MVPASRWLQHHTAAEVVVVQTERRLHP